MRWLLHSSGQLHQWKSGNGEVTGQIRYNKEAHTFRIDSSDKRLFFLERTGFLHHKFLLRTEYSIVTGEIHFARHGQNGICVFEDLKYDFKINNGELILRSKKEKKNFSVSLDSKENFDHFELCALIFATVKILRSTKPKKELLPAF